MFFFDSSTLKILSSNFHFFFIFFSKQYGQKIEINTGKSSVAIGCENISHNSQNAQSTRHTILGDFRV